MIRIAIATVALFALALPAVAQIGEAPAPSLKAEAVVMHDIVRIGDLVDNPGAVANVAIFRAPDLGQTGSVTAEQVIDAVLPHHIFALDTRGLSKVVVVRASRMITAKDIEARIMRALANQTATLETGTLSITFDNEMHSLFVEPNSGELRVARASFEPRNGRFDVTLDLPGSEVAPRLRFTGTFSETFQTVVPTRPLAQGEFIKASGLTITRRPKSEYSGNLVTTIEQAAGFSARQALRAGQVIRQADLVKPDVIMRNEAVTITYEVPGIVLTVRGVAAEAGAKGDIINVINAQSKKSIQAMVLGPGRVSVTGQTPRVVTNVAQLRASSANHVHRTTE